MIAALEHCCGAIYNIMHIKIAHNGLNKCQQALLIVQIGLIFVATNSKKATGINIVEENNLASASSFSVSIHFVHNLFANSWLLAYYFYIILTSDLCVFFPLLSSEF